VPSIRPQIAVLLLIAAGALACGEAASRGADAPAAKPSATKTGTPRAEAASTTTARGRPLPSYQGLDGDGAPFATSDLVGRRVLLFGFAPQAKGADLLVDALATLASEQAEHNFEIVGVATGSTTAATAFLTQRGLEARLFADARGELGQRIGLRRPVWAVLVDADGNMLRGSDQLPQDGDDPVAMIAHELRDYLRIPHSEEGSSLTFEERPPAPEFRALPMRDGEPVELSALRGRPVVLIFFLHTCPHCHDALRFLKETLPTLPEANRPELVAISVLDRPASVDAMLKDEGIDFFPVYLDADEAIRNAYGALRSVPVVLLIDAEGRLISRTEGWRSERDPPLTRMRLAQLTGAPVPMLLHRSGYSGNEFCGVCHASEAATWEFTNHAGAYDTLVRHGVDHKEECVSCHVVGFGEAGGFKNDAPEPQLENVGCETCHGRGGPHLSPDFVKDHDYEAVCRDCHNPEHSLGFDYASFLPRVSHAATLAIASLPEDERRAALEKRRQPRKNLLPTGAATVGSGACRSCHEQEYATWSQQPHALAIQSLAARGEAGNAECLQCHTTGFGQEGGFPRDGAAADHPELAAVGCESCHGPGGDHVGPDAARRGTIVSLTDKCDSCVILQICGSCHDDANDPGFEFEVLDKIEKQRHGTIVPGGAAGETGPQAALPGSAVVGLLERAFVGEPG
jgi:peroxiredoxin/nitrate/TMAO reductase-like tetraheme cytochrome c subunit